MKPSRAYFHALQLVKHHLSSGLDAVILGERIKSHSTNRRVPAETICDVLPGELFVHRNIANILPYGDISSGSVIQFAVEVLGVRHVIVCGHYNCGGVKFALEQMKLGLIDHWLKLAAFEVNV